LRKPFHIGIASAVVLSFGLATSGAQAAKPANHASATAKPPKLKKGITLNVWNIFANSDPEYKAFLKVLAAFTKKTGIKVIAANTPASNSNGKFQLAAPAGNGPDLIGLNHDQVAPLAAAKVLATIPTWAWSKAGQKAYIPGAVQASAASGHIVAMPWSIVTTGLFYNKSLISASAFKPAKGDKYLRWSKLLPKLEKLNDPANKKYGFLMDMNNFYYDYAFLSGYGGYVFKFKKGKGFDPTQLGLNSSAAVKAIKFYADLSQAGKYKLVPPTMDTNTADGLFEAGSSAVEWSGPWNEGNYRAKNINFGFAPLPSFDGKHPLRPFSTVEVYSVNKFSKHLNESFALLKYISQNMELPLFKAAGRIPVIKKDFQSKAVQRDPLAKQLASAALSAAPIPGIPEMAQVWAPVASDWQQVAMGKATAAAAASQSEKDVKAAIAKAHGG
jgi:arabinogalactan oligomer / maltooligosaccharide transport system substrate-binding protein